MKHFLACTCQGCNKCFKILGSLGTHFVVNPILGKCKLFAIIKCHRSFVGIGISLVTNQILIHSLFQKWRQGRIPKFLKQGSKFYTTTYANLFKTFSTCHIINKNDHISILKGWSQQRVTHTLIYSRRVPLEKKIKNVKNTYHLQTEIVPINFYGTHLVIHFGCTSQILFIHQRLLNYALE